MIVQKQELYEALAMLSDVPELYPLMLRQMRRMEADHATDLHLIELAQDTARRMLTERDTARIERDKYKARYEYLESLCCIGLSSEKHGWCELRGRDTVVICKYCATVDEAVDFVLGGNGDE